MAPGSSCSQTPGRADKTEDTGSPRPSQLGRQCLPLLRWVVDPSLQWAEGVPQLITGRAAPWAGSSGAGRLPVRQVREEPPWTWDPDSALSAHSVACQCEAWAPPPPRPAKGTATPAPAALARTTRHQAAGVKCFEPPRGWHNASTSVPGPKAKASEAGPREGGRPRRGITELPPSLLLLLREAV